jgi:membrane associated rhomboid family serine protease
VTPVVRILLLATVGAYLLQMTVPLFANLLVFVPQLVLVRPWTLVTYMFLHGGFTHILFNMIALFFFGPRVEGRIGSRPFTILYFLSGVSGALLSMVLAPTSPIIGASAGVFGVMLAFAHFWPHEPIYIWGIVPIPARILVILTTIITLWSGFGSVGSGIAHFAHLGGYAGAFLYLLWLERGRTRFKRKVVAAPPRGDEACRGLEEDRHDDHPRGQPRRGEPDPRQDQRAGAVVADAAGARLPVQLRPDGRPRAAGELRWGRRGDGSRRRAGIRWCIA